MPRKVRPGPAIFRLEGLSDGIDRRMVDDFTGQPLERTVRVIDDPDVARDAAKRKHAADQRALLAAVLPQALGIEQTVRVEPKLVAPHLPGQRAIATIAGNAVLYPMPPWRR